jgi:hypothetical protein
LSVQNIKKKYSWVPLDKRRFRAQMSSNCEFVLLVLDGSLYSLNVDVLLELVAGHRDDQRIFKLEEHSCE